MHAVLIVPPFAKSTSGPPLGPAMLRGAAAMRGHDVDVVDLAIEEVRHRVPAAVRKRASGLAGDHDKNEAALREAQREFMRDLADRSGFDAARTQRCELGWDALDAVVGAARRTPWARRARALLTHSRRPGLVGVSVMFADQVIPALVVTALVHELWRGVGVVWGGAHVTALAPEIAADSRYGRGIEGFVVGYAEQTFAELLDAVAWSAPWPREVFQAGQGIAPRARASLTVTPAFSSLDAYGAPRLSLPAQVTRGCAFGKCGFCTYPYVEGRFVEPPASAPLAHIEPIVALAEVRGAVVSFKDALMTAPYLLRVAEIIVGRARWSACTKLAPGLVRILPTLAASGCETLEVGLETVVERSQLVILKPVSRGIVVEFLSAADRAGIRVVVNYMTGLPGEGPAEAAAGLAWIRALAERTGALVEHHVFELERRAPLATRLHATETWPWASVVKWQADEALAEVA